MPNTTTLDILRPLSRNDRSGRFGYVIGEGCLKDTDLPTSVHWAYVDGDDCVKAGVFELASPDRYAANNYDLQLLRLDGHRPVITGSPEAVVKGLNALFAHAWVAVPVTLISPVRRLFRHVRAAPSWQSPDPWLPSRIGPWADLVLRVGKQCIFRPIERGVDGMPVAAQPDAYLQHYVEMRAAHRTMTDLIKTEIGSIALHADDTRHDLRA